MSIWHDITYAAVTTRADINFFDSPGNGNFTEDETKWGLGYYLRQKFPAHLEMTPTGTARTGADWLQVLKTEINETNDSE